MQKRRLVITAGHQGIHTGASSNCYDEGAEAISLRDDITKALKALGIVAINEGNAQTLNGVIRWLNKQFNANDVLVEIHFNASISAAATGTEVFTQAKPNDYELLIAKRINDITGDVLHIRERGIKTSNLSQHTKIGILDDTKINAVLWEVMFLSNPYDCESYRENKAALVQQIALALQDLIK